jgi:hypothetical protein
MRKNLQDSDRELSQKVNFSSRDGKVRTVFTGRSVKSFNGKKLETLFNAPILPAPKVFDIVETRYDQEFFNFLKDLEELLSKKSHIYLSFAETTIAKLPVFLLLYAIQDKYKCKVSVQWSKKSRFVNQLIKDAGCFKPAKARNNSMFDIKQKRIPVISGSNHEYQSFPDALVDAIKDKYYGGNIPDKIEARISQAVIETLENVGRHAYPDRPLDKDKKWWLICSIGHNGNTQEEYMYLAIFDSGQGIPLSFEDSKVFQNRVKKHYPMEFSQMLHGEKADNTKLGQVTRFVRTAKAMIAPLRDTIGDSGLIHASMMHDMTSLDDENHGQGSVSIKDVVTKDPDSRLIILSNRGCYQYNKLDKKNAEVEEVHTRIELNNELSGTLLQWSIKLDELD